MRKVRLGLRVLFFGGLFIFVTATALVLVNEGAALEAKPTEKTSTLLVIPNLRYKGIDLKTIYDVSNAMRTEAAKQSGYRLVNHQPLFKEAKDDASRDKLIALCKETGAEKAVLGIFKQKRQINYLKLELYNLKTDEVENKLTTVIATLRPMELSSISRGAVIEVLISD